MTNEFADHALDFELAQKLMAGDATAATRLASEIRPLVEGKILQSCPDEASREKAREIVADVVSECFSRRDLTRDKPSLLDLYQGRTSLSGWLILVASSRLKSWWRQRGRTLSLSPAEHASFYESTAMAQTEEPFDPDVVDLLRVALQDAFSQVDPEALVFMRLVFLHGIKRETIARVWGCHPSTIGRAITPAAARVQRETLDHLRRLDPYIVVTWADCVAICQRYPRLFAGDQAEKA